MAIGIIAKLYVKEGRNEEFESIFLKLQAAVRENEPGNNFYELHRSDNPQTYVVLEQYQNEDAVKAHQTSDHMRSIGPVMAPCMAGRPDLEFLESVQAAIP